MIVHLGDGPATGKAAAGEAAVTAVALAWAIVDGNDYCLRFADPHFCTTFHLDPAIVSANAIELTSVMPEPAVQDAMRLVLRNGRTQDVSVIRHDRTMRVFFDWFLCRGNSTVLVRVQDPALAPACAPPAPELEAEDTLERQVAERTRSLMCYQEELQSMARELTLAEQRERRRVAMELHDYLAQILVACRMKMDSLKKQVRSPKAMEALTETRGLLDESLAYTRTLIGELSPTVLYEAGLLAAFHWLGDQMRRRGLEVTVEDGGRAVPLSEDQAIMVFQSVRELLLNVVRHAEVDQARVQLHFGPRALTIVVSDKGKGFDMANGVPGPSATGKYGLFNIRERLQALGGRFFVQSAPGYGTRASLLLPLQPCASDMAPGGPAPLAGIPTATTGPGEFRRQIRVLLADDHAMIRNALRSLLENCSDVQVIGEAADGEEAIAMARSLRPDAVIMDVNMPKLNGIEATRRIRQQIPGSIVIGLSVYDDREVAASMREAGAYAYLAKGSAPEEIYRTLRTARPFEQLYFAE